MSTERTCLTCAHHHPNGGISTARSECWDCVKHANLPYWRPLVDRRVVIEKDPPKADVGGKLTAALKKPIDLSDESPWAKQVGGDHYNTLPIQPFEYAMKNKLDPMQHTVIKYVTRFRDKGGIKDLEKARHTIDLLIAFEKEKAA